MTESSLHEEPEYVIIILVQVSTEISLFVTGRVNLDKQASVHCLGLQIVVHEGLAQYITVYKVHICSYNLTDTDNLISYASTVFIMIFVHFSTWIY